MYVHVGEVLKYIRQEQGLTQTMLADCVGIQRRTVGRIEETGHGRIETLEKCLGWLGYELEVVPHDGQRILTTIQTNKAADQ